MIPLDPSILDLFFAHMVDNDHPTGDFDFPRGNRITDDFAGFGFFMR